MSVCSYVRAVKIGVFSQVCEHCAYKCVTTRIHCRLMNIHTIDMKKCHLLCVHVCACIHVLIYIIDVCISVCLCVRVCMVVFWLSE